MEKYTRFENIDDMICESHIIKLYGEELMMFKSFCDAVFGGYVKELYSDCHLDKYYVNDTEVEPYGFSVLGEYIRKRFGIENIRYFQFSDGFLRVKNYYTDNDGEFIVVRNGKNHV